MRRVGRKAAINIHGSTESSAFAKASTFAEPAVDRTADRTADRRSTAERKVGAKAAGGGKMKAGVRWQRKRKAKVGKAKVVTPLPEQLSRLVARAAGGEQGGSAAPAGGEASASGQAPVPAPAAPAAWPDEAEEPGGK